MSGKFFLGVDIGSITGKVAIIDNDHNIIDSVYLRTDGQPIACIKKALEIINERTGDLPIAGSATTGSGRKLIQKVVGADIARDEITAHSVAAIDYCPNVQTVIDIGGQDSKLIIIRNQLVIDFAMNSICAAGTGSFLDKLGDQLGVAISDFGSCAVCSEQPAVISGRCTVFAESDIITKKNYGYNKEDILMGLCNRLVENYKTNLGRGKSILPPILFQGGVAKNEGIIKAFEDVLADDLQGSSIIVPKYHDVMGAIGAAILAQEEMDLRSLEGESTKSTFFGWDIPKIDYQTHTFQCSHCENNCEILEIKRAAELIGRWGGKCSRWDLG
ncbi:MAG: 2-hydroxyglutaryl-CoA dehydratase [Asgard group archaeon]|nr:2-hydroxyglutaryl-CoA dehydratase [Asgard group archaeon]